VPAAALLISTNLCLFAPFEILSSNPAEFDVTFGAVLPVLIAAALVLAALITAPGLLVPRRFRAGTSAALLAVGVLLWIQGSFLRWGYGEFAGAGIEWAAFPWQGWVDVAVWIAVLVLAVHFRRRISRNVSFLALALILIQSGLLVARAIAGPDSAASPGLARVGEDTPASVPTTLCQLSSSRNVFHILMDGFQSDVFMELVAEEGLEGALDGFVVFPGNISTGSRTVLSVPSVFSTNVYSGEETEAEYFRKAAAGSFHYFLDKRGYAVNLIPHVSMNAPPGANYFVPPATYASPRRVRLMQASTYLIDVSMFRQFPQFLKRVVFNDQNWRLSTLVGSPPSHVSFHQKAFFRDYMNRLEVADSRPAYHFVHLMPPHGPYVTLADGSYADKALPNTRENYKNEARYILRMFVDFLDRLKDLGVYDSSVILLHGDHGAGFPAVGNTTTDSRISWMSTLMVLKTFDARAPLRVSTAQTSLTDIPATLLGLLGIEHPYPGDSVLELDPAQDRVRRVTLVPNQSAREPIVHRWMVRGNASDSTSWRQMPPMKVQRRIHHYEWGTPLRFGIAHAGDVYLTEGWSTTSSNYTWSDGNKATITFGIEKPQRKVRMRLTYFAWVAPGKWDRQRIRVTANGWRFPEIECRDRAMRQTVVTIPVQLLQTDRLVLTFEYPDAVVPRDIGEGNESRALAMGLFGFEAAPAPEKGTTDQ